MMSYYWKPQLAPKSSSRGSAKPKKKQVIDKPEFHVCGDDCAKAQQYLRSVFEIQSKFQSLAPVYGWRGLGNLLGDFGEFMAVRHYGLKKSEKGQKNHDAFSLNGRTIQVKTCLHSTSVSYRSGLDDPKADLIVLKVNDLAEIEEVYAGPFSVIKAAIEDAGNKMSSPVSNTDKKSMLSVTALKGLNVHRLAFKPCRFKGLFEGEPREDWTHLAEIAPDLLIEAGDRGQIDESIPLGDFQLA